MLTTGLHKGYYAEGVIIIAYKIIKSKVSPILKQRMENYCLEYELTLAELIRISLVDYLKRNEKMKDI